jgi:hypothetical protein
MIRKLLLAAIVLTFSCVSALAADLNGKWKAEFETQMGTQKYTYEFHVDGSQVTGKAVNDRGEAAIKNGKIDGDTITFDEVIDMGGNDLDIAYTGKIDGDEIKFTRKVGDFATETLVAKRIKE